MRLQFFGLPPDAAYQRLLGEYRHARFATPAPGQLLLQPLYDVVRFWPGQTIPRRVELFRYPAGFRCPYSGRTKEELDTNVIEERMPGGLTMLVFGIRQGFGPSDFALQASDRVRDQFLAERYVNFWVGARSYYRAPLHTMPIWYGPEADPLERVSGQFAPFSGRPDPFVEPEWFREIQWRPAAPPLADHYYVSILPGMRFGVELESPRSMRNHSGEFFVLSACLEGLLIRGV